ncbi:hypothetical protein BJ944DRAFT_23085 [Cunninghamella echinulata]|nr:hypothetical protein BJ944DRAFT_23085 [Cunninghamella echinulata]
MNLNSLLMKPIKNLEANVVGYLERSPLEVYENICDRLKTKKNTKIIKALAEETLSSALDLRGTDLKTDDIDTLIRFLNTITLPLNQIDLSANLLKDDDVIKLFDAIICPAKIILSSNLITLKSFDYFYEHHEDKLESIELSYTMIQSITQKQISDFCNKHPKLKHFNIDGCEIINE